MGVSFTNADSTLTVSFNRGRTLDSGGYYQPRQIRTETGGGNVQVCDIGITKRFITCNIDNITPTVYNSLVSFMQDSSVRWAGKPFIFTDENSNTYKVRWWSDQLEEIPMKSNNIDIKILLRVE